MCPPPVTAKRRGIITFLALSLIYGFLRGRIIYIYIYICNLYLVILDIFGAKIIILTLHV